jgi:NAD(P)-dependent dehydrogenase (short-subunit alcohol dehydrogenase family)
MQKTALVTGASRGLGEVIATYLARSGYDLVLTARRSELLEELANRLRQHTRVVAIAGDVSDPAHRARLASAAADLGGLDVLVNNASELGPSPMPQLTSYPLDELRRVFDVNVVAPVALVQETLPLLKPRRGLVVNITSDAAVGAYPRWGGYGSSKAALELVSRTLAEELREDGVSVVVVDPGDVRTDMHQAAFPGEDISDRPLPDTTIPFWAWLFAADPMGVTGQRFQAQGDRWELAS